MTDSHRVVFLVALAGVVLASGGVGTVGAQTPNTEDVENTTGIGEVETSSVADGPTVYFGSLDDRVYAVDAESGDEKWRFTAAGFVESSPTVVNGTVYIGGNGDPQFGGEGSGLYALDAETGEKEWLYNTSGNVNSPPTVVNGTAYIASGETPEEDGALHAVDAESGEPEWKFRDGKEDFGVCCVEPAASVVDGTVYIVVGKTVYALDAETGSVVWTFDYDDSGGTVADSLTIKDGTVYTTRSESMYAFDASTGGVEWVSEISSGWLDSSPTVVNGTIYVGSGTFGESALYAVNADTGETEWEFTEPTGNVESSPTFSDGTVYFGTGPFSDDPSLYAVDSSTGEKVWRFNETSGNVQSPTVKDGVVYITTLGTPGPALDSALRAVDAETGEQEWEFTEPTFAITSSPTIVADPSNGDSVGTRVNLGTLGHHHVWAEKASEDDESSPANFEVTIDSTNSPVTEGEVLNITGTIENIGGQQDTQTITATASGLGSITRTVMLNAGESTTEMVSVPTSTGDAGTYTVTVESENDTATTTVEVESDGGDDTFTDPLPGFNSPPQNTGQLNATLYEDVDGDGDGTDASGAVLLWSELVQNPQAFDDLTQEQIDALDWNGDGNLSPADAVILWSEKVQA
jgi:outer membrane protein assembly factor BamB